VYGEWKATGGVAQEDEDAPVFLFEREEYGSDLIFERFDLAPSLRPGEGWGEKRSGSLFMERRRL
jgi:hypothetical protein